VNTYVNVPGPPEDGKVAEQHVREVIDPTGNFGTLSIGANSFLNGNGGQACFPNPPWDKYYPLSKLFLGPNTTPSAITYTNGDNFPSVTVDTCNPTNGTTLETGIVIAAEFAPNTDKVCATNASVPPCTSPRL